MRDQPGVQESADLPGVAAAPVAVVVRDQRAQFPGIARFGERLDVIDQRADLVLGRARGAAGGAGEGREEREPTQAAPPTADGRP